MGTARRRTAGVSPLASVLVIAAGIGLVVAASRAGASSAAAPPGCPGSRASADAARGGNHLSAAQIANAQVIYSIAVGLHLPVRAAEIGIATAMQESKLQNLPYGTEDSLGLFQQRPSKGWGTPAEVMTPSYAATIFYRRLVRVPDWQALPLTVAAQEVQQSAYPNAYAQWEPLGTDLANAFNDCG